MSSTDRTTVRFIGVDSCVPEQGQETACELLNDDVLVDTGWNAVMQMRRFGWEPLAISHVFITHCHHDHYLGVAPLIFYRAMLAKEQKVREPLVVVGPRTEIGFVIEGALNYLQTNRYDDVAGPIEVVPLRPGEGYETDRFQVKSAQAVHPTVSLCYRFDDKLTGASIVITGDTAYYEPLGRFAAGADVLIHDASAGATRRDPLTAYGHSGALDAAKIAQEARPKRLYLVHCSESVLVDALGVARNVYSETYVPRQGEVVELPL